MQKNSDQVLIHGVNRMDNIIPVGAWQMETQSFLQAVQKLVSGGLPYTNGSVPLNI